MSKLKPSESVPLHVAKARALEYLQAQLAAHWQGRFDKFPMLCNPSSIADHIWPDHRMKAQGAAGAATRILKALQTEGHVKWESYTAYGRQECGYRAVHTDRVKFEESTK